METPLKAAKMLNNPSDGYIWRVDVDGYTVYVRGHSQDPQQDAIKALEDNLKCP